MKKLLIPIVATLALGLIPATSQAACPPGTTDPAYCTAETPKAATDNAKETVNAVKKESVTSVLKKGSLPIKIDAAGPGKVTVKVTAKIKGKTVVIASYTADFSAAAANTKVKLKLTKAGRAALKKAKGNLKTTISSSFKAKGSKTTVIKRSKATLKK